MNPTIYLRGWADLDEPIHYNESDLRHTYEKGREPFRRARSIAQPVS